MIKVTLQNPMAYYEFNPRDYPAFLDENNEPIFDKIKPLFIEHATNYDSLKLSAKSIHLLLDSEVDRCIKYWQDFFSVEDNTVCSIGKLKYNAELWYFIMTPKEC